MEYNEGLARLDGRAKLATAVLWTFVAVAALTVVGNVMIVGGALDISVDTGPLALTVALANLAYWLLLFVSMVLVARWILRAHANLHEAGVESLQFTPGWAVGWYFIPFANLVLPFQAMRELWNTSHGNADPFGGMAPSVVKWWWGAWITGTIGTNLSTQIVQMDGGGPGTVTTGIALGAVGTLLLMLAAVLLVRLIHGVTQAQRGGITAVGVFA